MTPKNKHGPSKGVDEIYRRELRIPRHLKDVLDQAAKAHHRSLAKEITFALENYAMAYLKECEAQQQRRTAQQTGMPVAPMLA